MKKLTVLAAALAAGMTGFAANAAPAIKDTGTSTKSTATKQEQQQKKTATRRNVPEITRTPLFRKRTTAETTAASGKKPAEAKAAKGKEVVRTPLFGKTAEAKDAPKGKRVADKKAAKNQQLAKDKSQTRKAAPKVAEKAKPKVAEKAKPKAKQLARKAAPKDRRVARKRTNKIEVDVIETSSITVGAVAGSGQPYASIVAQYASTYGVPVSLAHAVISVESNYRPNARGSAGEIGLMQIKPATARMMGYSGSAKGLFHPETNIKFGMKYLAKAHELGGKTTCGTILRYNAGHGARRMNPVSSAYCVKVKRFLGV